MSHMGIGDCAQIITTAFTVRTTASSSPTAYSDLHIVNLISIQTFGKVCLMVILLVDRLVYLDETPLRTTYIHKTIVKYSRR